jgi:hypothetical protein
MSRRPRYCARCNRCSALYGAHGAGEACPDGGGVFGRRAGWRPGQSFDEAEVTLLADVLDAVANHRPLYQLAKRPELGAVVRKVTALKRASVRAQADRLLAEQVPKRTRKLNTDAVRDIRDARARGVHPQVLAVKHGVARSTVERVLKRESWAHVE